MRTVQTDRESDYREREMGRKEVGGKKWRKWHPGMKRGERASERMTNRAVLSKERGRYTVKRGNRGPGVYKEKEEERGRIRFKNKRVREG